MAPGDSNGWNEWKNLVLRDLKQNKEDHDKIIDSINAIDNSIVALKVKSGVWGLIGGAIPVVIGLAYVLIKSVNS